MNKIINFHIVNDGVWFDSILCLLKSKYKLITIESLHEFYIGSINLKNSCHITIDDGQKSFYDIIFPVLKKHNVPASVYVSPKICSEKSNYWFQEVIGYNQIELKRIIADTLNIPFNLLIKYNTDSILKTRPIYQIHEIIKRYQKTTHTAEKIFQNMTVSNLKNVDQSGLVTIGAHTINHPILKNEDDANSKYEINKSVCELSTLLKKEIKYFAYPNGIPILDFTERETSYLRNIGIQMGFTTESNNFSINNNTMCIPRIGISNRESATFVKTKLSLGFFWNIFKRLKPTGEYRERMELNRIISTGNFLEKNN
jgi:peptidoglycan/xylan/chitin deacetylase (PgdA/CDA1 family)